MAMLALNVLNPIDALNMRLSTKLKKIVLLLKWLYLMELLWDRHIVHIIAAHLIFINARGGAFCPFHETQYGAICRVYDCQAPKINPSQACEQHQPEWQKYIQSHSCENLSGVRCILRRPGETLPWQPNSNIQGNLQPHDQDVPEHQKKKYFSPNCFYLSN